MSLRQYKVKYLEEIMTEEGLVQKQVKETIIKVQGVQIASGDLLFISLHPQDGPYPVGGFAKGVWQSFELEGTIPDIMQATTIPFPENRLQ
jgi:hypothetical protein